MKWASKITLLVALAGLVAVGSVGTARSDEPEQALVWPVPPVIPRPQRLGFYGHLQPGWGMMVDYVLWGTPAHRAGLESGDVIVRINHRRIRSYRDYFWALRTSGPVCHLSVDDVRGRGRIWVVCYLRRHPGPILLGGPRSPAPSTPPPAQNKLPGTFRPPSVKEKPPHALTAPEKDSSGESEKGKRRLL